MRFRSTWRRRAAVAGRGLPAHRHYRLEPRRHRHPPAGYGSTVAGHLVRDGTGEHAGLGRVWISNHGKESREVTFFAAESGDDKNPKRNLSYRDGVVMDGGSARSSARVPPGFSLEFQAEVPGNNKLDSKVDRSDPRTLLVAGGLYNALLVRGRIGPAAPRGWR